MWAREKELSVRAGEGDTGWLRTLRSLESRAGQNDTQTEKGKRGTWKSRGLLKESVPWSVPSLWAGEGFSGILKLQCVESSLGTPPSETCLLYTSDAADDRYVV